MSKTLNYSTNSINKSLYSNSGDIAESSYAVPQDISSASISLLSNNTSLNVNFPSSVEGGSGSAPSFNLTTIENDAIITNTLEVTTININDTLNIEDGTITTDGDLQLVSTSGNVIVNSLTQSIILSVGPTTNTLTIEPDGIITPINIQLGTVVDPFLSLFATEIAVNGITIDTDLLTAFSRDGINDFVLLPDPFANFRVATGLIVDGDLTVGNTSTDAIIINSDNISIPNNLNFDSDTFFIDSTNNRIGVGTNTPGNFLIDVNGTGRFTTLTLSEDLFVEGNTTIGNEDTDTFTVNANSLSIPNNLNIDSNTFFIDSTNNKIGIGTNTPGNFLIDINGTGRIPILTVSTDLFVDNDATILNADITNASITTATIGTDWIVNNSTGWFSISKTDTFFRLNDDANFNYVEFDSDTFGIRISKTIDGFFDIYYIPTNEIVFSINKLGDLSIKGTMSTTIDLGTVSPP
jgi:hypothetical protein